MHVIRRIFRNELTSTNSYARELLSAGIELPDISVIVADYQTGGRGQGTNSWESERGRNLMFSIVCHPVGIAAVHQFVMSQAVALAIAQTVGEWVNDVSVKWPNDIYWRNRKLCGILIECLLSGEGIRDCILGVGLNVNQTRFVSDAPNPVSLAQIAGLTFDREKMLMCVLDRFSVLYERVLSGDTDGIAADYKRLLYRRTGIFRYKETGGLEFDAEIADVEPSGRLCLRRTDGSERSYEFKEIKFII